ncbi:chromate resistance protein ChrB domain-containing protein [Phreatobacter sp. AB_2022a]|uniref:chromate resistance protein ChrB domain-containing protein n=1 Tax=Phreatobacter sp. AB_2022a TaxID=3003134 RepID=UPI002286F96C|nr:chromate resistance protein ChrB domain-containing protein [Phreatobacter sp. AB_2022a]MCZ0733940.1 chromate resistance protein [Phreatobacter sp. AB_2022a]
MNDLEPVAAHWLLLIHQLPPKPAYFRVKIWRRLQGLGAVAVKSTVYALPANSDAQEDFEWLLREIVEGGGEAMLCEARLIDGLSDAQVRGLFDAARDADYAEIAEQARGIGLTAAGASAPDGGVAARGQVGRLRRRIADVARIDFFGAPGRVAVEALLADLEVRLAEERTTAAEPGDRTNLELLKGRIWVTRRDVHVDRIACSWLIRRFIDPQAVIRFVSGKGYVPNPGELRFDMFEGEITHEGDRCSFEVLLDRAGLADPALAAIGEIVHDIDLKDGKFGREETSGIAGLVSAIAAANADDDRRIAEGTPVFDNLYRYFRSRR